MAPPPRLLQAEAAGGALRLGGMPVPALMCCLGVAAVW